VTTELQRALRQKSVQNFSSASEFLLAAFAANQPSFTQDELRIIEYFTFEMSKVFTPHGEAS
jgi:hypothetical protein